jgi:predicted RNA binding protein YcfA (HicA-like mRNA interferase family)
MRTFSGRELCAILGAHGFVIVRQKGSHIIMQKRTVSSTITVPVPDHREIKTGTLMSIIRQTGLPKTVFE